MKNNKSKHVKKLIWVKLKSNIIVYIYILK
jgi:hypothetical protein